MHDFIRAITDNPDPGVVYSVGTVLAINSVLGTVQLSLRGGTYDAVPYLLSYTPAVSDKVQVISDETVGTLVLGKAANVATPAPGTVRVDYLLPIRSMNWSENAYNGQGGLVEEGLVKQGSNGIRLFSGCYVYQGADVTLGGNEMITKAELLLARVDESKPMTVSPVMTELTIFREDGKPLVLHPEQSFLPLDMLPGDWSWVPVPVVWATSIVAGTTLGFIFSPTSAQLTLTYAEFEDFTIIVDTEAGMVAGDLRLTIQDG